MIILLTGGLGFIGSHCAVELLNQNHSVIIVDNLYNSKLDVLDKIEKITGKKIIFYNFDLKNKDKLDKVFLKNKIETVIHMAGLKAVAESVKEPLTYYHENINITLNLLDVMKKNNVKKIIFSSSGTVYGKQLSPYNENMPTGIELTNPYSKTKYFIEEILKDLYLSDKEWSIVLLRYFNPCGAHYSGLIGENPNNTPNNLMPILLKVADGLYPQINIYGNDYNTIDGTCIRDYIHVVDLAEGHVVVLNKINQSGIYIYNLGTGVGHSVLDVITKFQEVNNINIDVKIADRRAGDIDIMYALTNKTRNELNWIPKMTLDEICRDSWNAYLKNIH